MASLGLSDLKCSYPDYEDGLIISGQWYQSLRSQCIFIEMCCAVPFLYYTVSFRQNIRDGHPKTRRSLFWGVSYKFEMWLMFWLLGLPLWIWYRITIDRAITRTVSLQWRHNGFDGVSTHQPHHCLPNRVFRRRSKKTSKLRVAGLCVGNSPVAGEFPTQMVCNAENVSIWWRHHVHWFSCLMHPNSVSHSLRTQCQPNSVSMSAHDAWWGGDAGDSPHKHNSIAGMRLLMRVYGFWYAGFMDDSKVGRSIIGILDRYHDTIYSTLTSYDFVSTCHAICAFLKPPLWIT